MPDPANENTNGESDGGVDEPSQPGNPVATEETGTAEGGSDPREGRSAGADTDAD